MLEIIRIGAELPFFEVKNPNRRVKNVRINSWLDKLNNLLVKLRRTTTDKSNSVPGTLLR